MHNSHHGWPENTVRVKWEGQIAGQWPTSSAYENMKGSARMGYTPRPVIVYGFGREGRPERKHCPGHSIVMAV